MQAWGADAIIGIESDYGDEMNIKTLPLTAGEAAAVSGRSIENQRADRRAGYTPQHKGQARYSLFDTCRLYCIQRFADRGIGPRISVAFADEVARELERYASSHPNVWTDRALALIGKERGTLRGFDSAFGGRLLAKNLDGDHLGEWAPVARGVIVWPNDEFLISDQITREHGNLVPGDPRARGVSATLIFMPTGWDIAHRLPRPIFDIEDGEA